MRHSSRQAGIVGVGNMGGAMAARLVACGFAVGVRDIDGVREAEAVRNGASAFASPAALTASGGPLIVAVVDAAQCDAVLFGDDGAAAALAEAAAAGRSLGPADGVDAQARRRPAVILCPTIDPASVESIAARLAERGIDCIDAPMSGGPARARDGTMSLMVAAPDDVVERHRSILDALSSNLFRVGTRPGDGARTKLVNNLLAAINLAGAAEAIALAERVGLDAAATLAVIERSSGQSWIGSDRLRRALAGDLAPRAHTTLLAKDARLALAMARDISFAPALGEIAARLFADACREGFAALDDASLLAYLRRASGGT